MDADFDVHDHRHQLKQIQDSGETAVFENRDGLTCPACAQEFERLMLVEPRQFSFPSSAGSPFCLVRRADDLVLFRH